MRNSTIAWVPVLAPLLSIVADQESPSMRRPVGVKWVLLFFRWTSFSPAELPLSPPFHPHS